MAHRVSQLLELLEEPVSGPVFEEVDHGTEAPMPARQQGHLALVSQ